MVKRVIRLTQPASEPVTITEAKQQLRIPSAQTVEDATITAFISAAREQAEQFIDRPICEADFVLVLGDVDAKKLELKYPASAVASITYRDSDDAEQTATFTYDEQLNTAFFSEQITGTGVKVTLTSGQTSGYPESLKQAILLLIGDLYTGRSSSELVNRAAISLLLPFKNRPIV